MRKKAIQFDKRCYASAAGDYRRRIKLSDGILYRLCRDCADHRDPAAVYAKLSLIGRSYATGVERLLKSSGRQSDTLGLWGRYFGQKSHELNRITSRVRRIQEPLNRAKLVRIATAHGAFVSLLALRTRRGKNPTAFASKYLHFHSRAVPIYDSWASAGARGHRLLHSALDTLGKAPEGADPDYWLFLRRLWCVYQVAGEKLGPRLSVRILDRYLLEAKKQGKKKRKNRA